MFLDSNKLGDSCLKDANVAIEKTSESSRKECDWQTGGETKNQDTQSSSQQTKEKDWLSANLVAQSSPENTSREFGQSECRSDHAGVY